jgi:hypothetical protein
MERRVESPHSCALAYRWFYATYTTVLERKETLRQRALNNDGYARTHARHLNPEVYAYYRVMIQQPDDEPEDHSTMEIEYVVELFRNSLIDCAITLLNEETQVQLAPDAVKQRLEAFCDRTFYICKCNAPAQTRLNLRCADCYTFWYRRTDNDCCPICLDDEGRWTMLSCGHIIHTSCWARTPGNKCPVCRTIIDRMRCILNYPYHQ